MFYILLCVVYDRCGSFYIFSILATKYIHLISKSIGGGTPVRKTFNTLRRYDMKWKRWQIFVAVEDTVMRKWE